MFPPILSLSSKIAVRGTPDEPEVPLTTPAVDELIGDFKVFGPVQHTTISGFNFVVDDYYMSWSG